MRQITQQLRKTLATAMPAALLLIAAMQSPPASANAQFLVGHWRNTEMIFGDPRDTNLLFNADGTAQTWGATTAGRSTVTTGSWRISGKTIFLRFPGEEEGSAPIHIHDGKLVFPNIHNQRRLWDRVGN